MSAGAERTRAESRRGEPSVTRSSGEPPSGRASPRGYRSQEGQNQVEELRPASEERSARRIRARQRSHGARALAEVSALAPRDAGGILDFAIEGLISRFAPALGVALCVWLPFGQVSELLGLSGLEGLEGDLAALAWNTLSIVPLGITASVVVSLVGDALLDRRAPAAAGILRGLARAPGAMVILLVTRVLALPLVILCLAPYFLVQWLTWAAVPIYVLEGEGLLGPSERARARANPLAYLASFPRRTVRAVSRSVALTRGGPSLGRWLLVATVGQLVFGGILEVGAMAFNHPEAREFLRAELGFGGTAADLALGAAAAFFTALSACVSAALMMAFYLDLRVRREGWDLELALNEGERALPHTGEAEPA